MDSPDQIQASFYGGPADGLTAKVRLPLTETVEFPVILPGFTVNWFGNVRPNLGAIAYHFKSLSEDGQPVYEWRG